MFLGCSLHVLKSHSKVAIRAVVWPSEEKKQVEEAGREIYRFPFVSISVSNSCFVTVSISNLCSQSDLKTY